MTKSAKKFSHAMKKSCAEKTLKNFSSQATFVKQKLEGERTKMTVEERKEWSQLYKKLTDILTDGITQDEKYFQRLIWANEMIANALNDFATAAQ